MAGNIRSDRRKPATDLTSFVTAGTTFAVTAGRRRPSRGGPLAVLPILAAQPVVTSDWLARRLGVSERAAQMTLGEMSKLGIVREMTGRYTHRVYEAVG